MAHRHTTQALTILPILAITALGMTSNAHADEDTNLSDAETSYTGAVILEAGTDVTLGGSEVGTIGELDQETYAFFSGNTLYAGSEDEFGNTVDMIAEFFWFESSIDRGADFYVAVIKARNSPNLADWELEVDDYPVLSVVADTDLSSGTSAFRWDWSVPFENYGMDSYGEVTMETSYGIDTNAEGSAMVSESYDEDGNKVSGTLQAKGYANNSFQVKALYQVTLYRWEMDVHGTPGTMEWDMYLNTGDRKDQNAYHEYFLVMQAEEGESFDLDWLEISGTVTDQLWWWDHSDISIALTDIELSRPEIDEDETADDDDDVDEDTEGDDDDDDKPEDEDYSDDIAGTGRTGNLELDPIDDESAGCNTAAGPASPVSGLLVTALGLGLALLRRRNT